ncbi:MAG: hypothetical protein NTY19_11220 [Planctomycetota bacterium]|nr:hypothetical protein [Planctomycetota bacterium]
MELFSITCTTCQKRLKVLDASTIGQISICPHCGSMVLVEPPPQGRDADQVAAQKAGPRAPAETPTTPPPQAAPTAKPPVVSAPAPAAELSKSRQPPPVPTAFSAVADAPEPDVPEPNTSGGRGSGRAVESGAVGPALHDDSTPVEATVATSLAPPDERADGQLEPSAATAARAATVPRRREGLLIGGAAAVGLALALVVFGVLAAWNSSASPTGPRAAGSDAAVPPPRSPEPDTGTIHPVAPTPTESSPPEPTGDAPSASEPQANPSAQPVAQTGEDANPTTIAKPPETPSAAGATTTPQETAGKPAAADTAAPAPGFSSFAPFMDTTPIAPALPASESGMDRPAETDPAAAQSVPPSAPRPAPRQVDVAQRLKDEIPSIEFTKTPLLDLLQFIASFSTIPITLDPDALALVKVTPQTPVSVQLDKTNVDQVLRAALQPLRLGYVVVDDQVLVTRPPTPQGAHRSHKHSVQDLVGDDSRRLGQLTDLIVAMVEPESWQAHGGAGVVTGEMPSLVIEHRDTVLFRTLLFCDRLRVARGLPPQSSLNPELFQLIPRSALAAKALATRVTLNYLTPTLLVRILDQLRKDTGVQVLVDWQAVAELGWNPEAETTLAAQAQTLGAALDSLLRPLDLAYRVIDGQTLEITTPARLAARPEVEFYPAGALLPEPQTPEPLIERIRGELGLLAAGPAAPGGVFYFDPPSQYLIAALPQPQQRRLAELLAQWPTK